MLELVAAPFVACLILTGIHAYLGIHILERGVVFVDLALAQIAALGAITGFLLNIPLHTNGSYMMSLFFTLIGAAIFSFSRLKNNTVYQEAIIGIIYAVSTTISLLMLDKAPTEFTHIKEMLIGHLLFLGWAEVLKLGILYVGIGLFHFYMRRPFLLISTYPNQARQLKLSLRWYDFLFYASFGLVVTSSVEKAGILLVFCFLIVPALCSFLFFKDIKNRLFL